MGVERMCVAVAFNFHQLHIFYTVAQQGSFSAAAQALHMTQPAVTMQMQTLEEHFGTKLFRRGTKPLELTEAGLALLPFALQGVQLVQATDQHMATFTEQLKGRLQLGASLTIGEYVLPRVLGPFGQKYPDIAIHMKVMNTAQIVDDILANQLQFGLVEAPIVHPKLHSEPVMSDELHLIVDCHHPLAQLENVTLADALAFPLVLREQGSGTRQVMEEQFRQKGIHSDQLKIVMELGSTGAVKSAVEAGLGISFLSKSSVKHELSLGIMKLIPLVDVTFERQFYCIKLHTSLLSLSCETFLSFLRESDLNQWH